MNKKMFFSAVCILPFFLCFTFPDPDLEESMKRGKEVYSLYCQSCHMENGEGLEGVNPPIAKTAYVKDVPKNVAIILNGQNGEVTVNDKKYNGIMNPLNYLDDKQIADVLNYIRNSWGNKYPIVTEAQVKEARSKASNN
jgi:mono/diheme cytochrome c family protein